MRRRRKLARPIVTVQRASYPEQMLRVSVEQFNLPDRIFDIDEIEQAERAAQEMARLIGGTVQVAI